MGARVTVTRQCTFEEFGPEHRAKISAAIKRLGVSEVARRLGISTEGVLRLGGGFGSQAGTKALAVQRLPVLDEESESPDTGAA
jgi:hypothetical protein